MPVGALTPITRWQILDNGLIAPGAKAYFYASGTSTPLAVYTDAALTVAHAHPVVADAEGVLPVIYLQALAYRLLVTDSTGATIFPAQDNVYFLPDAAVQNANLVYAGPASGAAATPTFRALVVADLPATSPFGRIAEGRLTLSTGVPVPVADVTGATSAYWTPYEGNRLALYDGAAWNVRTFTEITISLAGLTASRPYDIFAYDNAGVVTIETLIWTSATARATALTLQDGVWVKTGALTRRYLGTIYINSSGGQSDDTLAKRYVWNQYNRVQRPMRRLETTANWTYTTATYRQANGAASNQLEVMVGVAEQGLDVEVSGSAEGSVSTYPAVAVGMDSTSVVATGCLQQTPRISATSAQFVTTARLSVVPAVGLHTFAWLEFSTASGTTTWYGDSGEIQSGMAAGWMN